MKTALSLSVDKTKFGPVFFGGDLFNGLRYAKDLGYDGVELSVRDPTLLNLQAIKNALDELALSVVTIGTGQSYIHDGFCFFSDDPAIVNSCAERVMGCVQLAAAINAPYVTIGGIRGRLREAGDRLKAESNMISGIMQCCRFAGENGVSILLEPVNHYEVDTIYTVNEAIRLIKDIGAHNIKVLYDTYHVNIEEESRLSPIYGMGKMLGHVHFADNNRLPPGCGCFDFIEVMRALKHIEYTGYVCIEALPLPNEKAAAKRAKVFLDNLFLI